MSSATTRSAEQMRESTDPERWFYAKTACPRSISNCASFPDLGPLIIGILSCTFQNIPAVPPHQALNEPPYKEDGPSLQREDAERRTVGSTPRFSEAKSIFVFEARYFDYKLRSQYFF